MTGMAQTTEDQWRVTCPDHQLDRVVATEDHARNLLALHERIDHPAPVQQVNLSAAARYVLVCYAEHQNDPATADHDLTPDRHTAGAYWAARDMWEALTGLTGEAALAYARTIADRPTTAYLPPL